LNYNSSDAGRAAYVYFEDESGRSPAAKLLTVRPADRSEHREAVVDADNLSPGGLIQIKAFGFPFGLC
jgi:hypothetical protein